MLIFLPFLLKTFESLFSCRNAGKTSWNWIKPYRTPDIGGGSFDRSEAGCSAAAVHRIANKFAAWQKQSLHSADKPPPARPRWAASAGSAQRKPPRRMLRKKSARAFPRHPEEFDMARYALNRSACIHLAFLPKQSPKRVGKALFWKYGWENGWNSRI